MPCTTIQIETGVPLPPAGAHGEVSAAIRALAAAKIGDSILVPASSTSSLTARTGHLGGKGWATIRKISDRQYRIWKIAEPKAGA